MPVRVGSSVMVLLLALAGLGWPRPPFRRDRGGQQSSFHSDVDLVSVYFTVRDEKKRLVSDLAQDKFSVSEDGRPQIIKFFAHHSDVVLNVGVLLDTGTNMPGILGEEAQASKLFVNHVLRPTDLGFILSYASRVETVQLPTSDVSLLEKQADTIGGGSAIDTAKCIALLVTNGGRPRDWEDFEALHTAPLPVMAIPPTPPMPDPVMPMMSVPMYPGGYRVSPMQPPVVQSPPIAPEQPKRRRGRKPKPKPVDDTNSGGGDERVIPDI